VHTDFPYTAFTETQSSGIQARQVK
jgi:hypothetical protein